MTDPRICPRCGKPAETMLACEYCGYRFQTAEGEVVIGLPGIERRLLRLNLRAWLAAGGLLVLVMCVCPQPWLYIGRIVDQGLGLQSGFWNFSNLAAASLIGCPVIYGIGLIIFLLATLREKRRS